MWSFSSVCAPLWFILHICLWQVCGTTRSSLGACDVAIISNFVCVSMCVCVCACARAFVQNNREGHPPSPFYLRWVIFEPCVIQAHVSCVWTDRPWAVVLVLTPSGAVSGWDTAINNRPGQLRFQPHHTRNPRVVTYAQIHTPNMSILRFTWSQSYYSLPCLAPPSIISGNKRGLMASFVIGSPKTKR